MKNLNNNELITLEDYLSLFVDDIIDKSESIEEIRVRLNKHFKSTYAHMLHIKVSKKIEAEENKE